MVYLPYTVRAIGHKAFFGCDKLDTVVFASYTSPILEEEFDPTYYECFENFPATGELGTYKDYHGNEVTIEGIGLVPYYMWNVTDGLYFTVYYGASFIDYVGYVEDKITMVKPINGEGYDSFVMSQYFDLSIEGAAAADDVTLEAIEAIKAIPKQVTYDDRAYVEAARAAYNKIATTVQQSLVTNYPDLIAAEQRITALTPGDESTDTESGDNAENNEGKKNSENWIGIVLFGLVTVVAPIAAVIISTVKKKKQKKDVE